VDNGQAAVFVVYFVTTEWGVCWEGRGGHGKPCKFYTACHLCLELSLKAVSSLCHSAQIPLHLLEMVGFLTFRGDVWKFGEILPERADHHRDAAHNQNKKFEIKDTSVPPQTWRRKEMRGDAK
jgi:hypothetical protein